MKKQTKPKTTQPDDSQMQTRVLLEEIRSEVKVVGEQHGTIVKRLDGIESELKSVKMAIMDNSLEITSLKTETKELKTGMQELKSGQEEIKQKLDTAISQNEERFKRIEAKLEIA